MTSPATVKRQDLSPIIHLYEPIAEGQHGSTQGNVTNTTKPPDLIILATWADAKLRPIGKYVQGYQRLYPTARVLVIQSQFYDLAFRPLFRTQKRLSPALKVVDRAADAHESILLHSLSNGGAFMATQLVVKYRLAAGKPLPIRAHIIDSAPGSATIQRGMAASAAAAPKGLMRPIVLAVLYTCCLMVWLSSRVLKIKNVVDRIRNGLLDRMTLAGQRQLCYIYSKTDDVIGAEDVEEHANEAEQKGFRIDRVIFEKSAHVAHLVVDPERYWRTVKKTWEQA
ncbi:MAG: hypothetical protein Q9157_002730 [Trypethelium eluteriae]